MGNKGFDCATPLTYTKAKQFYDQGFRAVGRYLADAGSWKRISPQEAQAITESGLYIVSAFERGADRAAAGAEAGRQDGILALRYAKEVGQPEGTAIYAAVDFDANADHYNAIEAYLRAFDEQITGYECGVYGEFEVCQAMIDRGVVSKAWQTYAWSRGQKVADPNFYQYDNGPDGSGKTINGMNVDLDESNGDAGGWKVGMAIQEKTQMPRWIAATIYHTWVKPTYDKAAESQDQVTMDDMHTLAEGLRAGCGMQPDEDFPG